MKSQIIAVDFDGTCCKHNFPLIGEDIGAVPVLKKLVDAGHKLILYTMRCNHTIPPISDDPDIIAIGGNYLEDAVNWFEDNSIELWAIQTNPTQANWTSSPKCYANWVIDDNAIGAPLKWEYDSKMKERAYIDWEYVEYILSYRGFFNKVD